MPLATSVPEIVVFIAIAVVIGVFKMLGKTIEDAKKMSGGGSRSGRSSDRGSMRGDSSSEEERTRKFLDALGLPGEGGSIRPQTQQAPTRPPIQSSRGERPVPPIVANPWKQVVPDIRSPRGGGQAGRTPPPHQPQAPYVPMTAAERARAEAFTKFDELKVPEVGAFKTVSSSVSAIPTEQLARQMEEAEKQMEKVQLTGVGVALLLKNREGLRAAIALREVLSPPRAMTGW